MTTESQHYQAQNIKKPKCDFRNKNQLHTFNLEADITENVICQGSEKDPALTCLRRIYCTGDVNNRMH